MMLGLFGMTALAETELSHLKTTFNPGALGSSSLYLVAAGAVADAAVVVVAAAEMDAVAAAAVD